MSELKTINEMTPEVLAQAAGWLVKLQDDTVSADEQRAFLRWRDACPEHTEAWRRAELLTDKLGRLPVSLAMPALQRTDASRRALVKKIFAMLLLAPVGWGGWRLASTQGWTADYRTATGEQQHVTLADGSSIMLNTATSVDVAFNQQQRVIFLRRGEVLIETAKDALSRPFSVISDHGVMQALGTRFSVRQFADFTDIAVLDGAVRIHPADAQALPTVLSAGQQVRFSDTNVGVVKPVDQATAAWRNGMMLANNMPLADFVTELNRYHVGVMRCDPAIAALPVLGAYPVSDPAKALNMLAATYPIRWLSRAGGYWISLEPR